MNIYDVMIIGGGPGGYSAALYCARAGLSTAVIEKLSPGGQMALTDKIDNYPGFDEGIDGFTLGDKMKKGAERFGAETIYGEVSAVSLKDKVKTVTVSGKEYQSYTVMIATGANPRELGLPNERALIGRGVSYCATCDGMFFRNKTVVVNGGGNTAAADALFLSRICKKVYVVHRRDTLRATKVYQQPLMDLPNVEFVWNSTVSAIHEDGMLSGITVTNVNTKEESRIDCDGLFVAIGRAPASELFRGQVDLDESGYIIAGESTCTNLPGVFAIGDVRTKVLRQVVTAAADGAVASHYAEEYLANLAKD